jgi:hypothetical protein
MKPKHILVLALVLYGLFTVVDNVSAQGTAFTYQGRLNSSGSPANGNYDFTFTLFNNSGTNSGQIGSTLTNLDVGVTNGLFTLALDFGGVFTGNATWLAIGVRTNGSTNFTGLSPSQQLTPTPYAVFANTASNLSGTLPSAQLTGPLPSTQISGTYSDAVNFSNSANSFTGVFSGNGSGLTNIPQAFVNVLTAGVTNDGVTDVTVPLQNLLNKGGAFYFPAGRYYAQELTLTNNTTLLGSGAVLVYASNSWNNNIFVRCMLNTNISISGITLDGGDYAALTTRLTFTYYGGTASFAVLGDSGGAGDFTYWSGAGRHGLQINTDGGGKIEDVTILGFSGVGLLPVSTYGTSAMFYPKTTVSGITCNSNFIGLWASGNINAAFWSGYYTNWVTSLYVPNALNPEYETYSHLRLINNVVGLFKAAGNNIVADSVIAGNYIAQANIYGNNLNHGLVSGTLFNHNIGAVLYIEGGGNTSSSPPGDTWSGCRFDGDTGLPIVFNNTYGNCITCCRFGESVIITNENSPTIPNVGQNYFVNNYYTGAWSGSSVASDGALLMEGNYCDGQINDIGNLTIGATGVTNFAPRTGMAVVTATSTTFWVSNYLSSLGFGSNPFATCVATNTSFTGTMTIPLHYGSCLHAASGLSGYMYYSQ